MGNIGPGQDNIYGRRASSLGKSALKPLEGKTVNEIASEAMNDADDVQSGD